MRSFWNNNKSIILSCGAILALLLISHITSSMIKNNLDRFCMEVESIYTVDDAARLDESFEEKRLVLSLLIGDDALDEIDILLEDLIEAIAKSNDQEIEQKRKRLLCYIELRRRELTYSIEEVL